jgi:hypothetical protein
MGYVPSVTAFVTAFRPVVLVDQSLDVNGMQK